MSKKLDEVLKDIDKIDNELIKTLAKRMDAIKDLEVLDENKREEVLKKVTGKAEDLKLSKDFIKDLFAKIHDHAVELKKKV